MTIAGSPRWVFGAEGETVDRASALVRSAPVGEVLVADNAAALISDRFTLAPVGERAYRLLAATEGAENDDGAVLPVTNRPPRGRS